MGDARERQYGWGGWMLQYMGGVPLFVGGNERRIYERGLFSFRDRLIKFMITWKSH